VHVYLPSAEVFNGHFFSKIRILELLKSVVIIEATVSLRFKDPLPRLLALYKPKLGGKYVALLSDIYFNSKSRSEQSIPIYLGRGVEVHQVIQSVLFQG
jgi:hypothetical protein